MTTNIYIELLAKVVFPLAGTLITFYLIPLIKEHASEKRLDQIKEWAKIGVEAAEKIYQTTGQGTTKKGLVRNFLENKGVDLTEQEMNMLIESAVTQLDALKGN